MISEHNMTPGYNLIPNYLSKIEVPVSSLTTNTLLTSRQKRFLRLNKAPSLVGQGDRGTTLPYVPCRTYIQQPRAVPRSKIPIWTVTQLRHYQLHCHNVETSSGSLSSYSWRDCCSLCLNVSTAAVSAWTSLLLQSLFDRLSPLTSGCRYCRILPSSSASCWPVLSRQCSVIVVCPHGIRTTPVHQSRSSL